MKSECRKHFPIDKTSPEIAAAYQRVITARGGLLSACNEDRQTQVAKLDESAWSAYEDEVVSKIECFSASLEALARVPSETIIDLALKVSTIMMNSYETKAARESLERDLEEIMDISPLCLRVDSVQLKRPQFFRG